MKQGSNRRLANLKTRSETGFDFVVGKLDIQTPFGRGELKELKPFFPGEEEALRAELARTEAMAAFVRQEPRAVSQLAELFMCMKDVSGSIRRSAGGALSEVEVFEVKSLLLNIEKIIRILTEAKTPVPEEFVPLTTEELLDALDPRGDRMNTFYVYDDFSEALAGYRRDRHQLEVEARRAQKGRREEISRQYGILLTPKFDIVIPRSDERLETARTIPDLEQVAEDYVSVTFALAKSPEIFALTEKAEALTALIEEEEARILGELSADIAAHADLLLEDCRRIGRLDFVLAKALFAEQNGCVEPEIVSEHAVVIEEGRQLQAEEALRKRGKDYTPISIELSEGVTCITGANMGGKTVSLKLCGLVPLLAQYGFFVPCRSARVGLSNFIQILIGDSQSVERGLSSFGSEMEELKEILDHATDRSLILIDEIASGTNPAEGLALTRSLVDYLLRRPYISLITTHFETVTEEEGVRNMQVRGLTGVDYRLLDRELKRANRKERINIIAKYMDYRLVLADKGRQIPKDALNIAKMLGIEDEIIEGAQKYLH